jgi:wyosine [tRNA(Phe)-imidazoG37] synthetase (radical SAM superfamily)
MPEGVPDELSADDHNASKAERTLVYPVHSRRAGGLSIGVNLNPGKECNWACVYCEVEGLVRGAPDAIDLAVLEQELDDVIREALAGRWHGGVEGSDPRTGIKDICIAGDGEPTLSPDFGAAVALSARLRERHGLQASTQLVVITNGSRSQQPATVEAFETLSAAGGEIWFKVDAGDEESRAKINRVPMGNARVMGALVGASGAVPTWIQTMVVHPHSDVEAIADLIREALTAGAVPKGILLYGLRRPSHQPGAEGLSAYSQAELESAADILRRQTGLDVRVFH